MDAAVSRTTAERVTPAGCDAIEKRMAENERSDITTGRAGGEKGGSGRGGYTAGSGGRGRHRLPEPPAPRGRRRRLLPGIIAAVACLVLLAGGIHAVLVASSGRRAAQPGRPRSLAAGGSSSAGSAAPGRAAGAAGLSATGSSAVPRRPAGSPGAAGLVFCPARPAAVLEQPLQQALASAVPGSASAEVLPLGVSADGRTAYVSAWTSGFAGVAALNLATGALRKIQVFADPAADQADGSSDGRWLVWADTYSLGSLDDFTIFAWDSVTGRRLRLGHSIAGPNGVPWPSPWHAPAVSGSYAAWAQGYGPGGLVEIRLADLTTGRVTTIRTGHTQPPFFDGDLVVWPESDTPGSQTTLRAYSLATGRLAALPAALRGVRGTDFVVTDGTRTAYLSPSLTGLYYSAATRQPGWRSGCRPARTSPASRWHPIRWPGRLPPPRTWPAPGPARSSGLRPSTASPPALAPSCSLPMRQVRRKCIRPCRCM